MQQDEKEPEDTKEGEAEREVQPRWRWDTGEKMRVLLGAGNTSGKKPKVSQPWSFTPGRLTLFLNGGSQPENASLPGLPKNLEMQMRHLDEKRTS